MNVIFFQEGYDPRPDANSICTKNIVDELKRRGDNVYVICDGVEGEEEKFSEDSSIIHVKVTKEESFYRRNIWGKIDTILKRFFSIPIWPIRFPKKVKKYVAAAEELLKKIEKRERVVIISVYRPAEMVAVGYMLKKKYKDLLWFIYSLDGIDTMVNLKHSAWLDKREREWNMKKYDLADYIIQMRSNYEHYSKSLFSKYLFKTIIADLPLITETSNLGSLQEITNDKVTLLYGGAFYRGLREPYYLLSWFKELLKYKDIKFKCYTKSPFQSYIDQVIFETGGRLTRYDYILPEEMDIEISRSDVLINIGNAASSMVPSKLFVYISARKPIIHFINDEKDSCLPYLKKYPSVLIINQNDSVEKSAKDALLFFDNIFNSDIQYQDLVNFFPENIPSYTVDFIKDRIIL